MIGELVGARYKVINVLGSGGFGHTYIAADTQRPGNPHCVLKHLTFKSDDPEVLRQVRRLFQAEAETLERLGKHDQIPRLLAYFEENQQFFLVQEFIDGAPLSVELKAGVRLSEAELVPMLEDALSVLEFVHAEGVVHRDIKPANLMRRRYDGKLVLIDFGAVKMLGNTVAEMTGETNISMPVYTSGYAASEQCLGRPRFSSDIYSLGMVGIQALTGLHPSQLPHDYQSSEVIWQYQAEVSEELARVLNQMTRYHFKDRYASAQEALAAVREVIATAPTLVKNSEPAPGPERTAGTPTRLMGDTLLPGQPVSALRLPGGSGQRRAIARIGLAVMGTLAVAVLVRSVSETGFQLPFAVTTPTNPAVILATNEHISSGEKALLQWDVLPQKQAGIDHFAGKRFEQAVAALTQARQADPTDPETLIYLNNARIGNGEAHQVAVVVPLRSNALESALEVLRGVAQAQDELNRAGGIQGVPLKVVIADDGGDRELARQIAENLANEPKILGIVGHGSSDTSLAAAAIYQNKGLVMVAPVSSAVQLSEFGSYIFRTMPSDKQTANALKDYLLQRLKKRRVAIFHNANGRYSQSLREEFKSALGYSGVSDAEVVAEVDLARPDFDPDRAMQQAIAAKAEVLMLAPDGEVMDRAIRLVETNDRRLPILAGDSLYNPKLLKFAKAKAAQTVLAVPVDLTGAPFKTTAQQLWQKPGKVSWRTALSYDAAQAMITALGAEPSRSGLRRALTNPGFTAPGANGTVNFEAIGDRRRAPTYVSVVPIPNTMPTAYQFKPLPPAKPTP